MPPKVQAKRAYDATSRIERAEAEKAETRRRVVTAAHKLFVKKGYVATTIADIAKEAGVAVQSVYTAGQSKADLMHHVVDMTVAGDFETAPIHERPFFAEITAEKDPKKQVALLAEAMNEITVRLAPVWVAFREAAAVDAKAAAELAEQQARRRQTLGMAVDTIPAAALRRPHDEAADTLWSVGSVDVFLLLMSRPGWNRERHAEWLRDTLVVQLLKPAPTRRSRP